VTADLLRDGPIIVNVGIREFAESVAEQEARVVHVEWSPPPKLPQDLADLLKELT
jgi:hypothetical protein